MNVRRVVLALASLLLLTLSVPAFASPRIVRLSYVAGDVRIDRNKAAGVEQAILNMPVVEGTRIYTVGDDARLEIEFENGSTMRLVGNGEVAFRQLGSIDNGNKQSVVEMVKGTAYFDVKNHDGDDFRVMLHDRDVTVRRNSHFRIQLEEPETTVAVFNGELELEGQAERVLVKKNETLSLNTDDHARYFLARSISTMEGDAFDQERLQYVSARVNSNAYRYAGVAYGEPYSYGVADLDYYGGWTYYPGYGYLWRPAGYGIAWDPFAFGAWSYYSGSGWVYVSSYPWGWTPYRYGRWVNVAGYGWCWGPYGGYHRQWYPVPVVVGYNRGGRIYPGHGPIPVPWVSRPVINGGRTVAFGGGGVIVTHRDGRDHFERPIAPGNFARPGRADDVARFGRATGPVPVPNGAVSVQGSGALTTHGGAIPTPGGAITTRGGAITSPGGAITTQGGAVRPVTPGSNRIAEEQTLRDTGRDTDMSHRENGHNPVNGWQAPPVGSRAGASAAVPSATPAVTREPHSFERGAVRDTPSERMSAPPVTAPVQRQSVSSGPGNSAPPVTAPRSSAPEMRSPMSHPAPPVTAPRESAPRESAPPRESRPAPSAAPVRSPQSSHSSAPAMRGGGGARESFARGESRGGSTSSHGSSGGGHSQGGGRGKN